MKYLPFAYDSSVAVAPSSHTGVYNKQLSGFRGCTPSAQIPLRDIAPFGRNVVYAENVIRHGI